jgi:hypothetical protein
MQTKAFSTFKFLVVILVTACFILLFTATMNFIQAQFASVGWHDLASIGWNGSPF